MKKETDEPSAKYKILHNTIKDGRYTSHKYKTYNRDKIGRWSIQGTFTTMKEALEYIDILKKPSPTYENKEIFFE